MLLQLLLFLFVVLLLLPQAFNLSDRLLTELEVADVLNRSLNLGNHLQHALAAFVVMVLQCLDQVLVLRLVLDNVVLLNAKLALKLDLLLLELHHLIVLLVNLDHLILVRLQDFPVYFLKLF